jgi:hypothetical protein
MWWKYYFETWVYCIYCIIEILMILWKKVFSFPVQYLTLLQYSSRMLTSRWQESKGSFVLSQYLFSILNSHLMISLKLVFNEKPPLLNITLSPVKLSSFWDCLARTNFEQNWKNLLGSVTSQFCNFMQYSLNFYASNFVGGIKTQKLCGTFLFYKFWLYRYSIYYQYIPLC